MDLAFFESQAAFRDWLARNHESVVELWVGYYKKGSRRPSITYPQSVDEALCFGWIDGVRRSIDDQSYMVRFTPRKPKSIWSAVNLKRVEELKKLGRLHSAGLKTFESRDSARSGLYSFENRPQSFPEDYEARFMRNRQAWAFFQSRPPWYRRTATFWVVSAKQEATRRRRLETLITDSEAGRTIAPLTRPGRT